MNRNVLRVRGQLGALALATLIAACGGSPGASSGASSAGGSGGAAPGEGGGGTTSAGEGTTGADGSGSTAGGGAGAGQAGAGGASGGDAGGAPPLASDPAYEGVDTSGIPKGVAPAGCKGAFDTTGGTITLSLDASVPNVLLSAAGGKFTANGVACTGADGSLAVVDLVTAVKVEGGAEDNVVVFDLSAGNFGAHLFSDGAGVDVELGSGHDAFTVRGSAGVDNFAAGTLDGHSVFDLTHGGDVDIKVGPVGSMIVSTGPANDVFDGRGGKALGTALAVPVQVFGCAGDDQLAGGAGDDRLFGGDGNDHLLTDTKADGADVFDGGDGIDTADFGARTAGVWLSLNATADDGDKGEGDDLRANIERVIGGNGDDTIVGSPAADSLSGGPGDDLITGGAGDDHIDGGPGDDSFDQGATASGKDVINGGDGFDTVLYVARVAALTVKLCSASSTEGCAPPSCGCAAENGEAGEKQLLANVEGVRAGAGNDHLTAAPEGSIIYGGPGDDTILGGDGDDSLYGEEGNDVVKAGPGDDLLDGTEGNDTLDGGSGDGDICLLGAGEKPLNCELY